MDSLYICGAICLTICLTVVLCFLGALSNKRKTAVDLEREKQNALVTIEREKNERILQSEELKTERERIKADKTAVYANRDMLGMQLEAGVLSPSKKEEDGGLNGILNSILPIIAQNPNIINGLFNKGAVGNNGGSTGNNPVNFPSVSSELVK